MKINARPHINGNHPEDFRKVASEVYNAVGALQAAIAAVSANVTHGRNYQHLDDPATAREEDLVELSKMRGYAAEALKLAVAIAEASRDR